MAADYPAICFVVLAVFVRWRCHQLVGGENAIRPHSIPLGKWGDPTTVQTDPLRHQAHDHEILFLDGIPGAVHAQAAGVNGRCVLQKADRHDDGAGGHNHDWSLAQVRKNAFEGRGNPW